MTEYPSAEPPSRRHDIDERMEDGGPALVGADAQIVSERTVAIKALPPPEPQPGELVTIMGGIGVLGVTASTTGLVYIATTTSEPFWRSTTAIYFISLALAIWALGTAVSQMIQRRQFIGMARAAGWSLMEDARLRGTVPKDELARVQQLRSQLYAIGAHREGEDLSQRVDLVIESQLAVPDTAAEPGWE